MTVGEPLQPQRRVELCPFGTQNGDGLALLADFGVQAQHAFDARGRFHLDAVDIGRGEHQDANHEEVDDPHDQPLLVRSERTGHDGNSPAACTGAAVRLAARSLAERARGLAAISASPGTMGRLVKSSKLGAACATSGRWREPAAGLPRWLKKFLTMRSSSEWNDTTASRPPGFSRRSAARSASCSSSSSSLTKIRKP